MTARATSDVWENSSASGEALLLLLALADGADDSGIGMCPSDESLAQAARIPVEMVAPIVQDLIDGGLLLEYGGRGEPFQIALVNPGFPLVPIDKLRSSPAPDATKAKPARGFVYVLRGCGFYKIGRTRDAVKRMRAIPLQLPFRVDLVLSVEVEDSVMVEREIHSLFSHRRANGEWFELSDEDLSLLKSSLEGYAA